MNLLNKVATSKSTSKYPGDENEGSYSGRFVELEFKVNNTRIQVWGVAVFTWKSRGNLFASKFVSSARCLTDIFGKNEIRYDYLDDIKTQCLKAGFMPSDLLLTQAFMRAEKELLRLHNGVIAQAFPKPREVLAA